MSKISIYQVFTRLFGNVKIPELLNGSMLQNGVGKMNHFSSKALSEIKKMGITHVWYTGIIAHARCEGNSEYNLPAGNPKVIKGRAGSPYAICDYYDVNADLAESVPDRMQEFDALIERNHKLGLKVIIDFVPNHVAREYQSTVFPDTTFGLNDDTTRAFLPTNDFYYVPDTSLELPNDAGTLIESDKDITYIEKPAKVTGNDQFDYRVSTNDWYETVKLNYGVDYLNGKQTYFDPIPELWNKMVNILEYWAAKGVDGFRCDMVEMVPVEFWRYAIQKVKSKFHKILFVAEVYNPDLYRSYINDGGFDLLYDKVGLYDSLKSIIIGKADTSSITKSHQTLDGISHKMLSFLENHDEQRFASHFFSGNPHLAIPAMLLSATINNGAIMTYFGQEVGEPAIGESGFSGDDGRTTIFDYYNVPEFQKWVNDGKYDGALLSNEQLEIRNAYSEILNFAISHPVFSEGAFYDLMWVNSFNGSKKPDRLYTYMRYNQDDCILLVVNFSDLGQQFILNIPDDAIQITGLGVFDTLNVTGVYGDDKSYTTSLNELKSRGLWLSVPAHSGKAFSIKKG